MPDRNFGRGALRAGGAGLDRGDRRRVFRGGVGESTSVWVADYRETTDCGGSEGADIDQGAFFVTNTRKKLLTCLLPEQEYAHRDRAI